VSNAERHAPDDLHLELVCFGLEGVLYAVDVTQVLEIVRCPPLAPLPHAPPLIEGLADLRGVVLPIVDLGRVLGGRTRLDAAQARIAVLQIDDLVLGLRVGTSSEVLSLPAEQVEALPRLASQAGYELVRAVVRRPGAAPVLVLSLEALLERVYRSGPPSEAAA
jgi:purine-binding chemotaxis protein CheW